ncbi:transcriptional regulator, AraC family [Filimonas lacunae]|uniref:Transcriptional regulator, AraC family n=1 Tax=Filimonas lacunae TaxID=477680 RepID=A0A173MFM4_9BACT|nr:AraC family transcriptional regulator [Filimonas lacunae]BAV06424.1 transcriptional regulator, AraC family [Filimonas lacunae]SIT26904.1 transcriptional regulator, AraC family [Filimonas lacunae]
MEENTSRYIIDEISKEHFIGEHYFMYVCKGIVTLYDGIEYIELHAGECCIARKNRLGRYYKRKVDGELEKVILALDETFLRKFQEKYAPPVLKFTAVQTCTRIKPNELLPSYIQSLLPYYHHGKITDAFAHVKREELLIILLQQQPELAGLFFDYGTPQKINIEAFMNQNYKFNVSNERLAFLTGRSLSAFKRDFKEVFQETPNRWLVQRRLKEAYFLIEKKFQKPSDIYYDLGFEALSHFSFAFKKQFGLTPTELAEKRV